MAGLSTFQSGPKGSKNVRKGKPRFFFDYLGPFWAHLDTFGRFQTKINLLPLKDKVGFGGGAFEQKIILLEMVQKGRDGTKRVPNSQKHLC